jgi:lysophospholipase L1-like esterase
MVKKILKYFDKRNIILIIVFSVMLGIVMENGFLKSWFSAREGEIKSQYYASFCKAKKLKPNTSWPNRIEQFEFFNHPADAVMIGDSITHQGHWEDIFPDKKIVNRGVGGDRTDDVLRRIDNIIKLKPNKVFLMIGINDLLWGRCVEDVLHDYFKIISILNENKINIFIQSTIECSKAVCGEKLDRVRLLNKRLESYSGDNNLKFIDLNEIMTDNESGLLGQYTTDGIHLSGAGYVVWRNHLEKYINE